MYHFLVPAGSRVLEIGCGQGNLLASLKPCLGVGVDFSPVMVERAREKHPDLTFLQLDIHDLDGENFPEALQQPFDAVILSDVVNDLWDVQETFRNIRSLCSPETRIILNFHSHLWEKPAQWAQKIGAMTPRLEQNWLTPGDMNNLLQLAGFEVVRRFDDFLWPWKIPL
jgi:SAM-dependent methyltransferase